MVWERGASQFRLYGGLKYCPWSGFETHKSWFCREGHNIDASGMKLKPCSWYGNIFNQHHLIVWQVLSEYWYQLHYLWGNWAEAVVGWTWLFRRYIYLLWNVISGRQLDGVWHTGIVVYGQEFFFGGDGISSCNPVSFLQHSVCPTVQLTPVIRLKW